MLGPNPWGRGLMRFLCPLPLTGPPVRRLTGRVPGPEVCGVHPQVSQSALAGPVQLLQRHLHLQPDVDGQQVALSACPQELGRGRSPSSGVHVCLCFSFWLMPAFLLKKIVLGNFARGPMDPKMADGIDFMVDRVRGRRGGLLRTVSELCGDFLTKPASLLCGCVPVVELLLLCVCSWRVSTKAS